MTKTPELQRRFFMPETCAPVNCPSEDRSAELFARLLSFCLSAGKSGLGYSPHERGAAAGPAGRWPGFCH